MIKLIAAIDTKRGIAKTGATPWYIKADLKHFRDLTTGHTILMGHSTHKTIGRLLPNRVNVVASRNPKLKIDGTQVINDITQYLSTLQGQTLQDRDLWVIGGEEVFKAAMPYADELYLTQIDADFQCDKFFPPYENEFKKAEQGDWQVEGKLRFRYEVWRRQT